MKYSGWVKRFLIAIQPKTKVNRIRWVPDKVKILATGEILDVYADIFSSTEGSSLTVRLANGCYDSVDPGEYEVISWM